MRIAALLVALVVIPAPYFKRYSDRAGVKGFLQKVSAAATGAIAVLLWSLPRVP